MNCEFAANSKRLDGLCTIPISTAGKNQPLSRIVIQGIKNLAKQWKILSQTQDKAKAHRTHQIASAYYLSQLP